MVPFWVLNIVRHLIFRVPKKERDHNFDNHPCAFLAQNLLKAIILHTFGVQVSPKLLFCEVSVFMGFSLLQQPRPTLRLKSFG